MAVARGDKGIGIKKNKTTGKRGNVGLVHTAISTITGGFGASWANLRSSRRIVQRSGRIVVHKETREGWEARPGDADR